ncbi:Kinesin-like protein KIF13A [Wickerhamiella sorbophila]|uniref:Kinesin-like protein KIF13A n=1 Tax=Wickerhamiella sorbophila TaxID=45607 RepID=A0A2T0FIX5_9ASCO|nr:Kinesin-like protein KIF13A [Wickerhamiella sorbophila]PRT54954.1 Kinesin-like protein KIF13A [Wickerhamiella sorbophila]
MLKTNPARENIKRGTTKAHSPLKLYNPNGNTGSPRSESPLKAASGINPPPPVLTRPSSPLRCKSPVRDSANVKVAVRVRPLIAEDAEVSCLLSMAGQDTFLSPDPTSTRQQEKRSFTFDKSFWSASKDSNFASQEDVYELFGKEFLDHSLEGYNTCIFAYGQTGSGKSYTMMGTESEPGIIPQLCSDLFERIEQLQGISSVSVRASFCEIYNEQVRDLLSNAKTSTNLKIRENSSREPYVEGLSEFTVKNVAQVLKYLKQGNAIRATASTNMNSHSSRSHAVFSLEIRQLTYEDGGTEEKRSLLRLVDLAGSERTNATGATGQRLREGSNINKSLVTLGRVISALASDRRSTLQVIPYRESVLTRLLQDSLGGNSKTAMIACISPTNYEQTLSTLRYAVQAKHITTEARVNQDRIDSEQQGAQIEEMQKRLNDLQLKLSKRDQPDESSVIAKVAATVRFYEDRAALLEARCRKLEQQNDLLTDKLERTAQILRTSGQSLAATGVDRIQALISEYTQFGQTLSQDRETVSNRLDYWTAILEAM